MQLHSPAKKPSKGSEPSNGLQDDNMRFEFLALVVLSSLGCAWAQQKELVSAPLPNRSMSASSTYANLFDQSTPRSSAQRSWYWEANDQIQAPSLTDKYLPKGAVLNSSSDFSPASLEWTFTGKRKLMPTLDLTLVKIKPGEGTVHDRPGVRTGAAGPTRSHLWDRATHSISDILHTE
jgi:hypothetical protein